MNIQRALTLGLLLLVGLTSAFATPCVIEPHGDGLKIAHGPTFPPDPWDGKVSHGPTFPPDPWDGK